MNAPNRAAAPPQRWRGVPESTLSACNEQEKSFVREFELTCLNLEWVAVQDITQGCRNRFQFAKTYQVLRADLRRKLGEAQVGNPNAPPHVNQAVRAVLEHVGQLKLAYLATWFYATFADERDRRRVAESGRIEAAIEAYAGVEGAGCAAAVFWFGGITAAAMIGRVLV